MASHQWLSWYRSKQEKKKDKLLTMNPQEITYDMVSKKLKEVIMSRGKKGVDRREQVSSTDLHLCSPKHPSGWMISNIVIGPILPLGSVSRQCDLNAGQQVV